MSIYISKNAAFKAILNLFNIILPIAVISVVTKSLDTAFASFGVYQYGLREISKVRDDKKTQTITSLICNNYNYIYSYFI